jgi:carbon storage regulator
MTEENALVAEPNRWVLFQGGHAMLVLTRKPGESVVIGDGVTVTVVAVEHGRVRLGFNAPKEVPIQRTEVQQRIEGWLPALQNAECA